MPRLFLLLLAFSGLAFSGLAFTQTFTYKAINIPGAKATYPFGLSDKRMIGGTYVDSNGGIHGFVATPNF